MVSTTRIVAIRRSSVFSPLWPAYKSRWFPQRKSIIIIFICSILQLLPVTPNTTSRTTTTTSTIQQPVFEFPAEMSIARTVVKAFKAIEKSEGAGAKVRRSIGVPQLRNFSPFLMLDHFSVGIGAGFPDHPHRFVPLRGKEITGGLTNIRQTEAKRQSPTSSTAPSTTRTLRATKAPSTPATSNS